MKAEKKRKNRIMQSVLEDGDGTEDPNTDELQKKCNKGYISVANTVDKDLRHKVYEPKCKFLSSDKVQAQQVKI